MADIKIETNLKDAIEQLEAAQENFKRTLHLQMFRALTLLEAQIKQNLRGSSGLHRRTGSLLNSIQKKVYEEGGAIVGEIGAYGIKYAAIHEFGGTVTAKNAKFLTIPTEENRRNDGTPKMSIKDVFNSKKAFITKKGAVMMETGKGKLTPMFILRKSVTIPARPYIKPALAAKQEEIAKNFGLFLSLAFAPKSGE